MVDAKAAGSECVASFGRRLPLTAVIQILREKPFLGAVLALYLLTWFLALWRCGWTVALGGSAAYAAGQAWGMRRGKFHLSADAVALPLAVAAVLMVSVLPGAAPGTGYLPGLVTAWVALGMAYLAGHAVVAFAAALLERARKRARRESGDAGQERK